MIHALWIFGRGFAQVAPVAINTWQLAHEKYLGAFICGFVISGIWWKNAGSAARNPADWWIYGLGASTGTITGLAFTRWWYSA
jgi:hypothetical protein